MAAALSGCAMHWVYEKPGLDARRADQDWAECQAQALAAAGQGADPAALRGQTSVSGARLTGEVTLPQRRETGTMVSPADYLTIKKHEAALQACMGAHGYRFVGVPAPERL